MGIINFVKGLYMKYFASTAETEFNTEIIQSLAMETRQQLWLSIIQGTPYWAKEEDLESINFGKFICEFMSKKACLDVAIHIEDIQKQDNERAKYIDKVIAAMVDKVLRDKVEDACGLGGIILKPTGIYNPNNAIDYVLPQNFAITEKTSNGDILGAIFFETMQKGNNYYTRLEYHHFETDYISNDGRVVAIEGEEAAENDYTKQQIYVIENRAYKSGSPNALGNKVELSTVKEWSTIEPIIAFSGIAKPLFAYFKMPGNNVIDFNSPEGVAFFDNAIKELKDLDVAWDRMSTEIEDSQHITFINEQALRKPADKEHPQGYKMKMPRWVQGLSQGIDGGSTINEHVPTILINQRKESIDTILSMISTKCGLSQGQFVLDRKTGMITATQIESDDQETVQTITDIRNSLKTAVKDLVYAIDCYCDAYFDLPEAKLNILDDETADEDVFYFKDLLASFEQDRARAMQLLQMGIYSKTKYLQEYEGFSAQEAADMMKEATEENAQKVTAMQGLFSNSTTTDDENKLEEPTEPEEPIEPAGLDELEE